jgi:selenoprotein W-related protein
MIILSYQGVFMKVIDPVCFKEVEADIYLSFHYEWKSYYFCSKGCRNEFKEDPSRYVKASALKNLHNRAFSD